MTKYELADGGSVKVDSAGMFHIRWTSRSVTESWPAGSESIWYPGRREAQAAIDARFAAKQAARVSA